MPNTEAVTEETAVLLARECLYRFLAAALSDPYTSDVGLVLEPNNQQLARSAADLLREEANKPPPSPLGFGELPLPQLDLAPFQAELRLTLGELRAEHDRVFGLVLSRECPPYETEYYSFAEPFFRAQQLADIAGFYRAFGLETAQAAPERPDHLALELEFMAFLLRKERLALTSAGTNAAATEQAGICADAQQSFLRDHLAWWVPSFAMGLRRKAERGFYLAVCQVLAAFMPIERVRLGVAAPRLPLQPALIERPEEQTGCSGCVSS
ncbi:MAG TPA: molecular chaperone TorD family protein [Gemmataceae bacterium]|jgi:TorA maturation chaperone TorD